MRSSPKQTDSTRRAKKSGRGIGALEEDGTQLREMWASGRQKLPSVGQGFAKAVAAVMMLPGTSTFISEAQSSHLYNGSDNKTYSGACRRRLPVLRLPKGPLAASDRHCPLGPVHRGAVSEHNHKATCEQPAGSREAAHVLLASSAGPAPSQAEPRSSSV